MPDRGTGNEVTARAVLEQIADAAVQKYAQTHTETKAPPAPPKVDIPAPLKWAGAIVSAILTAGVIAMCIWVVSTLSDLQQTVTRIDERQKLASENGDARAMEIDRRVTALEAYHRAGAQGAKP